MREKMDQNNKVAIITGAGRGIGRGIALQLARHGWKIVINDIGNPEAPAETLDLVRKEGSDGLVVLANITAAAERKHIVDETIKAYGQINLLVNNAGIGPRVRMDMLEIGEESMIEVLAVNTIGPYFLTQLVSKKMIELISQKIIESGIIVNIGSISAYTSSTSRAEYCISKAAMTMNTILFADRLSAEGIQVFEIRPGIIKTPLTEIVKDKYDKLITDGLLPIKRWGLPEDIGKAIVAIAEGFLPYSTGQIIDVDGGFHIHRL
jgi:3-oxoacyl-[acyl-carrier protein] reductase